MFIRPKTRKFVSLTLTTLLILGACLPHSHATTQPVRDMRGLPSESDGDMFSAGLADNSIDEPSFFVRQHYHDFLNRDPDDAGLAFWINEITQCGADAQCIEVKRINVSAAFFLSIEFQETGYLVQRFYKSAYGDAVSPNVAIPVPIVRLGEFLPDTQRIGQGVMVGIGNWEQQLEANKNAYAQEFVQRQRFIDAFPLAMTPEQFVDKLNQNSGGVLSQAERDQLVAELAAPGGAVQKRASVVRKVAEDADMKRNEFNRAFVLMQYYGYLRRNPDDPQDTDFRGWEFWLNKLNQFNGNFIEAEMVKAFISSIEYRARFGPQAIALSPVRGAQGQTLNVSITGQFTNFIQGTTTANFGAGISVGGAAAGTPGLVTVTSRTSATAQLMISDSAAAGLRTVVVATGPERVTLDNGFTVGLNSPALLPLVPSSGQQGQMLAVTIAGQFTNFAQMTTQARFGAGISVGGAAEGDFGSVTVTSPTSATAQIKINAAATTGPRDVTVRTGQEQVALTNGFNVTASAPPQVSDFNPKSAPVGTLVNVTGTNIAAGAGLAPQVTLQKQGGGTISAPLSGFTDNSAAFVIPTGAATGALTLTSANGQSAISAVPLTIVASSDFGIAATPGTAAVIRGQSVAYSISLASNSGFTQLATLNVSGLPAGATASFRPQQITAGQTSVLTVSISSGQSLGISDLSVSASSIVDGIQLNRSAVVRLDVRPITTSFLGRTVVDDALQTPLAGVTITLLGRNSNGGATGCSGQTNSDAAGNFAFTNLPTNCTGEQLIRYDGLTATAPPGRYAGVDLIYNIVANQVTVSPVLVHLPRIDRAETVMVRQNAAQDQNIVFETIPNLSAIVYAGTTLTMPDGTRPDPFPFTAVQVPVDRLPDAKPPVPGMVMVFIVAFQPANSVASQPVAIFYPNSINTRPGTNMVLMTLDPRRGQMVVYGTGTVSNDGMQVIPDFDPANPGKRFGLVHFDWHGQMPPPNPTNPSPEGPCGPQQGKPVDLSSGVEVLTETDISINGGRGTVAVERTYRTLTNDVGPFGVGTSHNYGYRLNTNVPQSSAVLNLIMPDGNQFPFVRQSNGTLINTTIPALRGAVINTASDGQSTLRWKNGMVFRFTPGNFLLGSVLQSVSDPNGNTITLTRDASRLARITEIIDPVGRKLTLAYDGADRITSVTDPVGRRVIYVYNGQGTLDSVTNPENGVTRYAYDQQNRLIRVTDARGVVIARNTYDTDGRVVEQEEAGGGKFRFAYTRVNPLEPTSPVLQTVVTDPRGGVTTYRFNPQGFLVSVTDAIGQTRVIEREPGTNLLMAVKGGGACNVCGTAGNGDVFYSYDSFGNVTTVADALGNQTKFTYEPVFNKVSSVADPLMNTVLLTYDQRSNLATVTDERGNRTTFTYDTTGLRTEMLDPLGRKTTYTYDSIGNLVRITDPLGNSSSIRYDAISRPIEVMNSLGKSSLFTYDNLNRIVTQTDPAGGVTRFTYDALGNLLTLRDAKGNISTFTYDPRGSLLTRTTPLGLTDTRAYDLNGDLVRFIDRRGQVSEYTYDLLRRPATQRYQDGSTVTYFYDSQNRVNRVEDSVAGIFSFTYDAAGRQTGYANPLGTVLNAYDAASRLTSLTVVGQQATNYSYDAAGNLTAVSRSALSVAITYDAANRLKSLERSNGVKTQYEYDQLNRVLEAKHFTAARTLNLQTYTYDAEGNRSTQTTDIANQLRTQARTNTFDAANRLLQGGGKTYTYDENGNLTSVADAAGTTTYAWDARNRLRSVTNSSGVTTSFGYDFVDNLITKTVGSSSESYVLDDLTNVVQIDADGSKVPVLSGRVVDQHLAITHPDGRTLFALQDATNSTIASADENAEVRSRFFYEPFGQTAREGDDYPFQFTGRVPVGGDLYYHRARYYDSADGRFIQEDPFGFSGNDANLYRYANNNPLAFGDPTGEFAIPLAAVIVVGGGLISAGFSVYDAVEAHQSFGGVLKAAGRGFVTGAVSAGTGVLIGLGTGNPYLIGAGAGLAGNLADQAFDNGLNFECYDLGSAVFDTGLGAALGVVSKIPGLKLRGREPNVLRPRKIGEFGKNSRRLLGQEVVGGVSSEVINRFLSNDEK